jgi:uncharacterized protein YqgC (DUF456 family)
MFLVLASQGVVTFAQSQPLESMAEPAQASSSTNSVAPLTTSDSDTTKGFTSGAASSAASSVASTSIGLAFVLWGLLCVFLLLAGLPGTWLLIATAVAIDCIDWVWLDPTSPLTFHPLTLLVCALLAGVGELLEFLLSAAGAKRFGASARGMWGSVIGGMLGAVVGSFMLPIIGTILGAALGTATGAIIGELSTAKRTLGETMKPALGAVIGRILGTLAKLPIALTVWVVLAIAVFA